MTSDGDSSSIPGVDRRTIVLTATALVAFAANSLLCRLALATQRIDAASFTAIRLASGAIVLALLALRRGGGKGAGSWWSAAALFLYAAPFSYAYMRISTGIGALVAFGAVQATMIGWGIARGERPRVAVWMGLVIAIGGLVGLTAPGATAPDPVGALIMAVAGIAWAVYSLRGRTPGADPVATNASNFARTMPLVAVLVASAAAMGGLHASPRGVLLAVASGALASGLGYSIWYAALQSLTATRAAILQLLVPILAASGGIVLLDERVTFRLVVAGVAVLAGVALAARARA